MQSRIALVPNDTRIAAATTFPGTGDVATRCRDFDWAAHALGRVDQWPTSLRTAASMVLASPFPMELLWGPDLIQIYNDGYRTLMGNRHPSGLAQPAKDCWPDSWQVNAPLYEGVRAGESVLVEEASHHILRDGVAEDAWFTMGYSPVRDESGEVAGVLVSAIETTGTVVSRRRAEVANRAKGDFLSVMSHELRTPLNAIGGYAELLALGVRGAVTPEQRADLERIQASQRHLLDVINGVLAYAKVEAGVLHYAVEDVPMDELLSRCVALVAADVREKKIDLRHAECVTRLTARADAEKVQQIVFNVLKNAIKFTEPGGRITLSCAAEENKRLIVQVSDTGVGIAPKDLECVFQPFVQVDAKRTRAHEGTGLGLAISRELARGMGGDLRAVSVLGEGSTFSLVLACGRGDAIEDSQFRRGGE